MSEQYCQCAMHKDGITTAYGKIAYCGLCCKKINPDTIVSAAENTKLKPCPFCGCTEIALLQDHIEKLFFIRCCECCATSAFIDSPQEAEKRWDKRVDDNSNSR